MRPALVVVLTPSRDQDTSFGQRRKPMVIETLIPEASVEAFDEGVLGGLTRLDVVEVDAVVLRPLVQGAAGELPRSARPPDSLRLAISLRSVPLPAAAAASRR